MKWLYIHKCEQTEPNNNRNISYYPERLNFYRSPGGLNPLPLTWSFALEANVTGGWKYVEENIGKYDAAIIEFIGRVGRAGSGRHTGRLRAELCRKYNPNMILVGIFDSWTAHPKQDLQSLRTRDKLFKDYERAVELCDLVIIDTNLWSVKDSGKQMMWNDIFHTDKFVALFDPFDIEYLQTLQVPYEKRLQHIISAAPVNYHHTIEETAKVAQLFLPSGWKAGLTHIRQRKCPSPLYKLGTLKWWDYVDWISKSYLGVFNARDGGFATIAGFGACLKTPFVGSDTADYIVECFPDLARDMKDYGGQANLCKRLINEESFWREMTEKGFNICKTKYSFEGRKNALYEELKKRGKI